jgi:hypothetical protein
MADQPRREAPPVNESEAQRVSRALAEAAEAAEARQADELPEGGRFIVNGQLVGPNGRPLGDDGREVPAPTGTGA